MAAGQKGQQDTRFAASVVGQAIALARQIGAAAPDKLQTVLELVRGRRQAIDAIGSNGQAVACSASCFACCHQMVVMDPGELILLALYLKQSRTPEELADIQMRAAAVGRLPADPQRRFGPDAACPLLRDGQCTAYAARPLPCRITYAANRLDCARALDTARSFAGNTAALETLKLPWFAPTGEYAYLMQVGFDYVLEEDLGLRSEKVDMARGLAIALSDPAAIAAAWIEGKSPLALAEVRIGDRDNAATVRSMVRKLKLR